MAYKFQKIGLHQGWHFKAESAVAPEDTKTWRQARLLPTTIHEDLLANGLIPDPFLGKNEDKVQWVGDQSWKYRTTFVVPEDVRTETSRTKTLFFEGLDTYAIVTLNGKQILDSESMFIAHRIDVSHLIRGDNEPNVLEIIFDSAERRGEEEVEQHPEHNWTTFNSGLGRLATRKAQYHHGWDWGPKLLTCGPWRPIWLEIWTSRINDLSVHTILSDDLREVLLEVSVEIDGPAETVLIAIEHDGTTLASCSVSLKQSSKVTTSITLRDPKLWWPHTFGEQHLYNVTATLYSDGTVNNGFTDKLSKRIGIRKIQLIQQPLSSAEGSSFFFKVNNIPIFSGGSNWIPGDSFLSRISPSKYRRWVKVARESNQVMLRIWGGGIYEHEALYDACDELGILVWQDFMFACGMFPAYESFLRRVTMEAGDNIRRLRNHPCIALWCGNNEDYVIPLLSSIAYDPHETSKERLINSQFPARHIYEDLLPKICSELVPNVPYWPGSPFGGPMVNSAIEGDCHQWHVWHLEKFPYQDFPRLAARFISEFGMQAMPCLPTTQDFFPVSYEPQMGIDFTQDDFVQFHNKCNDGPETLHQYCEDNLPKFEESKFDLKRLIYSTQLLQSETVKTAYQSWRRLWKGPGKEYCGGALVWQLNDCWPVTSWALVDSHLRPKMSYWTMKRENRHITAGLRRGRDDEGKFRLEIWAANTSLLDVVVDVQLRAWNVAGGTELWVHLADRHVLLSKNKTTELGVIDLDRLGFQGGENQRAIVYSLDLTPPQSITDLALREMLLPFSNTFSHTSSFHEPLKEVPFEPPSSFTAQLVKEANLIVLELKSSAALKGVLVQVIESDAKADEVVFHDNGFDMLPEQPMKVAVSGLHVAEEHRLEICWLGGSWRANNPDERSVARSIL